MSRCSMREARRRRAGYSAIADGQTSHGPFEQGSHGSRSAGSAFATSTLDVGLALHRDQAGQTDSDLHGSRTDGEHYRAESTDLVRRRGVIHGANLWRLM